MFEIRAKRNSSVLKKGRSKPVYNAVKRISDIAGASLMLCLTMPLLAAVSAVIMIEDPGPVIYVHDRVGRNGRKIRVCKFRSMKKGSDDLEAILNDEDLEVYYREFKLRNDPRVTEIGHILRKTSLDELPQLFNVLQGSMSLVGPRPVMESELDNYTPEQRELFLSVKPGITGYWQVNGRNEVTYQSGRRQELELYYAENASILLDMKILLKTPAAILNNHVG